MIQLGDQKKVGYSIVYESQKSILEHLAGLEFQHVGSWGRRISQFSLVYMVKPCLKIKGLGRWFHGKDHLLLHRTQLQFPAPHTMAYNPCDYSSKGSDPSYVHKHTYGTHAYIQLTNIYIYI